MKLNLSGLYKGLIGLENKVVDLSRREVRPRITESDLQKYYDKCIENFKKFSHYFEDKEAYKKTLFEVKDEKRAKLVARDSIYPCIWNYKHFKQSLENMFDSERKENDSKYFYVARYLFLMSLNNENPFAKLVDSSSRNMVKVSRGDYEKYFSIIEIPNDRTQTETKASITHEFLHHVIINYQLNSGKLLTKDKFNGTKKERYLTEKMIQESVVNYLTELLLEDDKEALFEYRWPIYLMENQGIRMLFEFPSAILTGGLIGLGIGNPKILPLALLPNLTKSFIYNKYKKSKREELTKSLNRKEFKI